MSTTTHSIRAEKAGFKPRWLVITFGLLVLGVLVWGYVGRWPWTGLVGPTAAGATTYKTLWDWLDLLIVPVTLTGLGFLLNRLEKRAEVSRAEATARSEALQSYLDKMSDLLLNQKLGDSSRDYPIAMVARARTIATLTTLDGTGRGIVLQFLYQSRLIVPRSAGGEQKDAVVDLHGVDFRHAQADGLDLRGADLSGVDLSQASLRGANLEGVKLRAARMREANLTAGYPFWTEDYVIATCLIGADLEAADLTDAKIEAVLDQARLTHATLEGVNFRGSSFEGTDFHGARLARADLRQTKGLDPKQVAAAESLDETKLPGEVRAGQS